MRRNKNSEVGDHVDNARGDIVLGHIYVASRRPYILRGALEGFNKRADEIKYGVGPDQGDQNPEKFVSRSRRHKCVQPVE